MTLVVAARPYVHLRGPADGRRTALVLLVSGGFPVAGLGFVAAYRTSTGVHELFWLSVVVLLATTVTTFALAVDKRRAGAVLTVVLAVLMSLPKLLRSPAYFNFYDEQAHLRAVDALLAGGRLFGDNPLNRVVSDYPGMHGASAALAAVTGGSVFVTGSLLVVAVRAAGCLAVFLLAERLVRNAPVAGGSAVRVALLAVVMFVANPAFVFFDAQFAYESVASPLVAVVLLLAVRVADGAGRGEAIVAALLAALVVVTHHGSSYMLAGLLVALVLARAVARQRPPVGLVLLTAFAVAATAAWLFAAAGYTVTYVGPYVRSNLTSVPEFLSGGSGPRKLFGGFLPVPVYEKLASYAAVLILFGLFCLGVLAVSEGLRRAETWLMIALGTVYFLSLPLVALRGDQVSKRLWEFAFIGLAPVCGVALMRLVRRERWLRILAAAMVLVVFVGSGVARSGEHIRFPGPYLPSADPRSMTPDVIAAAVWIRTAYGPDHRITGDRTLAAVFGSFGMQVPVTYQEDGYPIWAVLAPQEVTPQVLTEIRRARLEWIAVDLRTAGLFPLTGFYFDEAEPGAYVDTELTTRALTKFDSGPFARAYDNGHVVLYRVLPWTGFSHERVVS